MAVRLDGIHRVVGGGQQLADALPVFFSSLLGAGPSWQYGRGIRMITTKCHADKAALVCAERAGFDCFLGKQIDVQALLQRRPALAVMSLPSERRFIEGQT